METFSSTVEWAELPSMRSLDLDLVKGPVVGSTVVAGVLGFKETLSPVDWLREGISLVLGLVLLALEAVADEVVVKGGRGSRGLPELFLVDFWVAAEAFRLGLAAVLAKVLSGETLVVERLRVRAVLVVLLALALLGFLALFSFFLSFLLFFLFLSAILGC